MPLKPELVKETHSVSVDPEAEKETHFGPEIRIKEIHPKLESRDKERHFGTGTRAKSTSDQLSMKFMNPPSENQLIPEKQNLSRKSLVEWTDTSARKLF